MTFPAKDSIIKRKSVRTFDGKPLSAEDREKLQVYIDGIGEPFGVPVDLRFLEAKDYGLSSPVIIGEHTYLAVKVKRQENCEIAFGYAFEKVCLYAMSLGITGRFVKADPGIEAPAGTEYIMTFERKSE